MNIFLNFFPVRSGGGQQVASNFLTVIGNNKYGHNWFIFVAKNSELHLLAKNFFPSDQLFVLPYSYVKRALSKNLIKGYIQENNIDLIYNYCPVLPVKGVPQVVWSVYGNLYYPEINFWEGNSKFGLLKKSLIDRYRLKGTLRADGIIVENESILERAKSLFKIPENRISYILPSIREFDETEKSEKFEFLKSINEPKVLFLSSFHLNKNIQILPLVAQVLKRNKVYVKFVLSLEESDEEVKKYICDKSKELQVDEFFEYIGKVEAKYVHQVIKLIDYMILLSKLESFSNNVLEAFYFKKPLLISDEEWARAACKNSALYVNRNSPEDIAKKIQNLSSDLPLGKELIGNGTKRLRDFNTPKSKVKKEIEFLEYIYEQYESKD